MRTRLLSRSDVTLRPYRPSDALAMFTLDRVCFEQRFRFSLHAMRDFAEAQNAVCVVAEADGALVGFAIAELGESIQDIGSRAYLVTLDVDPEWRRGGLARRMMEWLDERVWELGARRMSLHVFVGNVGAIRFYERLGFEHILLDEGFYGEGVDAIFYLRRLSVHPS